MLWEIIFQEQDEMMKRQNHQLKKLLMLICQNKF
jgi:hypothetical protein